MTLQAPEPAIAFDQVGLVTPEGRVILDRVSLQIAEGSTTALLGRSGSGKTTLLRMVNRLIEPTAGRVLVEARATTDWDPIALRRSIGYVIQETGLFPHFDAERNIGTVLEIEGRPKQEIAQRARQLFTQVGLDYATFARRLPYQLSGGQRQRVAIARALIAGPKILLLDEPTSALDVSIQAEVLNLLGDLRASLGLTYIMVGHNLAAVSHLCEQITVMQSGEIVESLSAADLRERRIETSYTRHLRNLSDDIEDPFANSAHFN